MITGKTVTEFHKKQDEILKEESDRFNMYMKAVSPTVRRKLGRYNGMIRSIVYQIEKESGWEHTNEGFTCLSDFVYDREKNDITYKKNFVKRGKYAYHANNKENGKEIEFVRKYESLLERLYWCEKVRDSIYAKKDNRDRVEWMKARNAILEGKKEKEEKQPENDIESWVELSGRLFVENYQQDGINRLLKLLNALVDWKETDLYPYFMNEPISDKYKKDLVKWAALFNNRGMYLLDLYNEKEIEKERGRHY